MVKHDKKELRSQYIKKRSELTDGEVNSKSKLVFLKIEEKNELYDKGSFGIYLATKNEVDTKSIIDKLVLLKKEVFLPRFFEKEKAYFFVKFSGWKELESGYYGIMQPKSSKKADIKKINVIFIPGIAFDKKGVRLGWGTGTYDQLLKGSKALKIALAYDFQIVESLPQEEHDVKVDMIVTDKRVVGGIFKESP